MSRCLLSQPHRRQPSSSYYQQPPVQDRRREAPPIAAPKRTGCKISPRRRYRDAPAAMAQHPSAVTPYIDRRCRGNRTVHRGNRAGLVSFIAPANGQHHDSSIEWRDGANRRRDFTRRYRQSAGRRKPRSNIHRPSRSRDSLRTQTQSAGTVAKPSPRVRQAHLVAEQSEKQIGDDVVIRHYSRPVPTAETKTIWAAGGIETFF